MLAYNKYHCAKILGKPKLSPVDMQFPVSLTIPVINSWISMRQSWPVPRRRLKKTSSNALYIMATQQAKAHGNTVIHIAYYSGKVYKQILLDNIPAS